MKKVKKYNRMNTRKTYYQIVNISLLLFFISAVTSMAQTIESKLDEYIHAYVKLNRYSGSVLIAKEGKIILNRGYGMADIEHDVPNTPQTKFRLGSITKQFTSMAIMQLQERELLSVEDPITSYLPDFRDGEKITIHHLLTHTSGIPNFTNFPEYAETMMLPSTVEKTIDRFKDKSLEFEPGERYRYSNSGYIVLGYIVEKVAGESYEDYIEEQLFKPLNMKSTGYDHHETILKNRASGYSAGKEGFDNARYVDMTIPHAAGALYSTVEDLYLWDRALYTEKLLSKSSLDKIFTPFKGNYGYGWSIRPQSGHKRISHGGGINGFSTTISRYVDDDICIIVLSNLEFAPSGKIATNLASILFGEEADWPKEQKIAEVNPSIYDAYVGRYELRPNLIIAIIKEENRLFAQATGQSKAEIFPESEEKFFWKVFDAQISFIKNEQGEVTQAILHRGDRDQTATKIE